MQGVQHAVEVHAIGLLVKVGIGGSWQPGGIEDLRMVRPGRIAQPHGALAQRRSHKVGRHAQCTGAAGRLRRHGALRRQDRVAGAEQQLDGGAVELGLPVDRQVVLCVLRAQQALLGRLHRGQNRGLPGRILVDAHAQIDLLRIRIFLERLRQPQELDPAAPQQSFQT